MPRGGVAAAPRARSRWWLAQRTAVLRRRWSDFIQPSRDPAELVKRFTYLPHEPPPRG